MRKVEFTVGTAAAGGQVGGRASGGQAGERAMQALRRPGLALPTLACRPGAPVLDVAASEGGFLLQYGGFRQNRC